MYWYDYKIMKGIDETIEALKEYAGNARVVAGGTDLMIQCKQGDFIGGVTLLDVSSIPEMRGIKEEDGWIRIGAATTMYELAESAILQKYGRALSLGANQLGSPQIRSVATLGGNVVNAQPAGDGSIPLIALGTEAKIVSSQGEKWVLVEDLFVDIGQSKINPSKELVTHFRFRSTGERAGSSVQRLAKRKAFALPLLVVAAMVELDEKLCTFNRVRVAAGPVAKTPWRAREAEELLTGSPVSASIINKAAYLAKIKAQPRDSLRGGAEYRKEMIEVLFKRAISDCLMPFSVIAEE